MTKSRVTQIIIITDDAGTLENRFSSDKNSLFKVNNTSLFFYMLCLENTHPTKTNMDRSLRYCYRGWPILSWYYDLLLTRGIDIQSVFNLGF